MSKRYLAFGDDQFADGSFTLTNPATGNITTGLQAVNTARAAFTPPMAAVSVIGYRVVAYTSGTLAVTHRDGTVDTWTPTVGEGYAIAITDAVGASLTLKVFYE